MSVSQGVGTAAEGSRSEGRLDIEELAYEAGTSQGFIDRLVEIGAIVPAADGTFERGDVIRSRVVSAFEAEGFSLDQMAGAIQERAIALDSVPLFYPDPGPRTGRTFDEFRAGIGPRGTLVAPALAAMGLSAPAPDAITRVHMEALVGALVGGWSGVDDEYTLRAARIFGDAARRAAEGWVALFREAISAPIEAEDRAIEEVVPRLVESAAPLSAVGPRLLAWLFERHLERTMNDLNIARIQTRLERRGLVPHRPAHPPAVAFVDMSGYTRLTAEGGDERGALAAVRLSELAESAAHHRGGRVVKLLGDGVLLVFPSPCAGVEAIVELMGAMLEAGLPPGHAGVHAGPMVERDGDVFGTTVNLAARIASHAGPGALLATDTLIEECADLRGGFVPLGEVTVKGLDHPVSLCRWVGERPDA